MHEQQQFAAEVLALIPDGSTWIFEASLDNFEDLMPGIECVKAGSGDWSAVVGSHERQLLLELLKMEDEENYWFFGTAYLINIEYDGQLILRSYDGMEFVEFSKHFEVPEAFRLKYFIEGEGKAKQANKW